MHAGTLAPLLFRAFIFSFLCASLALAQRPPEPYRTAAKLPAGWVAAAPLVQAPTGGLFGVAAIGDQERAVLFRSTRNRIATVKLLAGVETKAPRGLVAMPDGTLVVHCDAGGEYHAGTLVHIDPTTGKATHLLDAQPGFRIRYLTGAAPGGGVYAVVAAEDGAQELIELDATGGIVNQTGLDPAALDPSLATFVFHRLALAKDGAHYGIVTGVPEPAPPSGAVSFVYRIVPGEDIELLSRFDSAPGDEFSPFADPGMDSLHALAKRSAEPLAPGKKHYSILTLQLGGPEISFVPIGEFLDVPAGWLGRSAPVFDGGDALLGVLPAASSAGAPALFTFAIEAGQATVSSPFTTPDDRRPPGLLTYSARGKIFGLTSEEATDRHRIFELRTSAAQPANLPPVARDDIFALRATSMTLDVLANDRDFEKSALKIIAAGPALFGTASIREDEKAIIYTPGAAFLTEVERFAYTIQDEDGATATATVRIAPSSGPASFSGLFNVGGSSETPSTPGHLRFTVSRGGAVSGTLLFGGRTLPFLGEVDEENRCEIARTIAFTQGTPSVLPVAIRFTLGPLRQGAVVEVEIGSETADATFLAKPSQFRFQGSYTLHLPIPAPKQAPSEGDLPPAIGGSGHGTVRVSPAGNITMIVRLSDGSVTSLGGWVDGVVSANLFRNLYPAPEHSGHEQAGWIGGALEFAPVAQDTGTVPPDVIGEWNWVRRAVQAGEPDFNVQARVRMSKIDPGEDLVSALGYEAASISVIDPLTDRPFSGVGRIQPDGIRSSELGIKAAYQRATGNLKGDITFGSTFSLPFTGIAFPKNGQIEGMVRDEGTTRTFTIRKAPSP